MIGFLCYAAAAVSGYLVAFKRHEHVHIANALLAAAAYSLVHAFDAPSRAALPSLVLIPAVTTVAYLRTWSRLSWWPPLFAWAVLALFIRYAPHPRAWWTVATWGPFLACALIGLTLWLRERRTTTITERVTFGLLLGDFAGLALVPVPDVVETGGRVMAVFVTVAHVGWLIMYGIRSRSS